MEIMLELFLTVFVALVFSFLIAKLVSLASVSGVEGKCSIHAAAAAAAADDDDDDDIIMKHVDLADKFKVKSFESENKVDFVKESGDNINKVDVFKPVDDDDQDFECENKVVFKPVVVDDDDDDDDQGFECENKVEEKTVEREVVERSKVEAIESEKEVEFMQETAQVEVKEKLDDIVVENKIEEIESQNEERQMKGLVEEEEEEEKKMKVDSYDHGDDDDWEGIEKSELENVFGAAAKFTEQKGDLGIGNDVEMELYGLHKIATEGPCRESQPLAFMLSSRSKWNAWQRLGNMNPEEAMEKYVTLLSDKIPGWMEDNSDGVRKLESAEGVPGSVAPDINSVPDKQAIFTHERNADLKSAPGGGDITESTSSEKQAKDD